jgi:hypothetical protein
VLLTTGTDALPAGAEGTTTGTVAGAEGTSDGTAGGELMGTAGAPVEATGVEAPYEGTMTVAVSPGPEGTTAVTVTPGATGVETAGPEGTTGTTTDVAGGAWI